MKNSNKSKTAQGLVDQPMSDSIIAIGPGGFGLKLDIVPNSPEPEKSSDRFGNRISLIVAESTNDVQTESPFVTSIEGTDTDEWPPSPPLQDFSIEPRQDQTLLLAVGMAGRSHWSASIAANNNSSLEFDMACRLRSSPSFLGSTFQLADDCQFEPCSESRIVISLGNEKIECVSDNATIECNDCNQFSVVAKHPKFEKEITVQWKFLMRRLASQE